MTDPSQHDSGVSESQRCMNAEQHLAAAMDLAYDAATRPERKTMTHTCLDGLLKCLVCGKQVCGNCGTEHGPDDLLVHYGECHDEIRGIERGRPVDGEAEKADADYEQWADENHIW